MENNIKPDFKLSRIMPIWFPFSTIVYIDGNLCISICPETDVISEGQIIEEALEKLKEKVEKFMGEELL